MIHVNYAGKMKFIAKNKKGHRVIMDTIQKFGGEDTAPTPMEHILMGLGGCTGMDVVSILNKMKQVFSNLDIRIVAENADDYPHVFTKIKMDYSITGKNLDEEKVKRAIELSQNKYCSVSAMLNKTAQIDWVLNIIEEANEN